jgi:hypothetical protein
MRFDADAADERTICNCSVARLVNEFACTDDRGADLRLRSRQDTGLDPADLSSNTPLQQ